MCVCVCVYVCVHVHMHSCHCLPLCPELLPLPSLRLWADLFMVDAVTGVVRVIGDVRFSTTGTRSHELTIVARDRGAQPMLSSVSLTGGGCAVYVCICILTSELHLHDTVSCIYTYIQ